MNFDKSLKTSIFEIVKKIPEGKVAYFGQISTILSSNPRVVGWILCGMTDQECQQIPWYRVVSKQGYISALKLGYKGTVQQELLIKEGYELKEGFVNMEKHLVKIEELLI
jgi:methylated-DNA-protein-cysteine methyltransferase-like protein